MSDAILQVPLHHSYFRQDFHILLAVNKGEMSPVVRKQVFRICENKDADQLRGNHKADQHLCFRYMDSIIPLLSKS